MVKPKPLRLLNLWIYLQIEGDRFYILGVQMGPSDIGYLLLTLILLGVCVYPVYVWVATRISPRYASRRQQKSKAQSDHRSKRGRRRRFVSTVHSQPRPGEQRGFLINLHLDRDKDREHQPHASTQQPEQEQYPRYVEDGMREHPEVPALRRYLE